MVIFAERPQRLNAKTLQDYVKITTIEFLLIVVIANSWKDDLVSIIITDHDPHACIHHYRYLTKNDLIYQIGTALSVSENSL